MKEEPKIYGPETPNYQLLNEQVRQASMRFAPKGKKARRGKPTSQGEPKKPQ